VVLALIVSMSLWSSVKDRPAASEARIPSQTVKEVTAKPVIVFRDVSIAQDKEFTYSATVSGSVKNVGRQDARSVVIKVRCNDCVTVPIEGAWLSPREPMTKTIDYLAVGDKEYFRFLVGYCASMAHPSPPDVSVDVISFSTAP
jgi:hypothetical protein